MSGHSWTLLCWILIIPIAWFRYPQWAIWWWMLNLFISGNNHTAGYRIDLKLVCNKIKHWSRFQDTRVHTSAPKEQKWGISPDSPTMVTFFEEFPRNFSRIISCNWFLGNSREIPQNWSPRWEIFVGSQFWDSVSRISWEILRNFSPRNSSEFLRNTSPEITEKFLGLGHYVYGFLGELNKRISRNSWEFVRNFTRRRRKDSWKFPRIFRKIVTWARSACFNIPCTAPCSSENGLKIHSIKLISCIILQHAN